MTFSFVIHHIILRDVYFLLRIYSVMLSRHQVLDSSTATILIE
jgi:hypothetical protein